MARKTLTAERDYLVDRLAEISLELKRLTDEAEDLKAELYELPETDPRAGAIRRRRRYIARRMTDLKAERETTISERDALIWQLKSGGQTSERSAGQ